MNTAIKQALSSHPLTEYERTRLLAMVDPLVGYLNAPGDWGYDTRLGDATLSLKALQHALRTAEVRS
jgi:hypothetical protein